jgi:hypothetical protein
MSRSSEDLLHRALLPRLKLQTAHLELVGIPEIHDQALAQWLKRLPIPQTETDDPISEMGMSVTADLARWTWRAAGPTSDFIAAMAPYFAEIGAAQPELDLLTHAGITLQPDQLGCWLEQRGDAINAGWYLPLDLRLADVRFVLPSHPATDAVFAWAAEFGVDTTERVGRAAGAGSPYAELLLPLRAGDDVADQVHAALQLFESLEAAPPPDAALGLIMNLEHQGLALTVWLSDDGPVKVGLLAARPRTALMLELCDLTGATDHEPLASLQGILGVDAPSYVECQTRAAGFGVELHYQLDLEERVVGPES